MIGIGNHEYDHTAGGEHDPSHAEGPGGFRPSWFNGGDDSGGECGVPMYYRFKMPATGHSIWWYVFVCLPYVSSTCCRSDILAPQVNLHPSIVIDSDLQGLCLFSFIVAYQKNMYMDDSKNEYGIFGNEINQCNVIENVFFFH